MTTTLEQTAGLIIVNCDGCGEKLDVSEADFQAIQRARELARQEQTSNTILGTQYNGFFISPEKYLTGRTGLCCNIKCHTFATED